jgi:hypothetical protein
MAGQEDGTQAGWSSEVLLTGPPEAAETENPGADIEATKEARNRR